MSFVGTRLQKFRDWIQANGEKFYYLANCLEEIITMQSIKNHKLLEIKMLAQKKSMNYFYLPKSKYLIK